MGAALATISFRLTATNERKHLLIADKFGVKNVTHFVDFFRLLNLIINLNGELFGIEPYRFYNALGSLQELSLFFYVALEDSSLAVKYPPFRIVLIPFHYLRCAFFVLISIHKWPLITLVTLLPPILSSVYITEGDSIGLFDNRQCDAFLSRIPLDTISSIQYCSNLVVSLVLNYWLNVSYVSFLIKVKNIKLLFQIFIKFIK